MIIRLSFIFLAISMYACGQQATVKRHVPNPKAKKLFDSASVLIAKQVQYDEAIPLLNQAIQIDSDYTAPYVYKLSYLWQSEQYDSCLKITNHLMRLHPAVAEYYGQTGMLYYLKGDSLSSTRFFREATSLCNKTLDTMSTKNSQYNFVLFNKGIYLVFSDKPAEANQIFQTVSAKQTDSFFRDYFASFANKSKQEVLNQILQSSTEEINVQPN
ncbi:MAG: tetratricopeptide repeat protein [Flavisolibacter sp.]